MRQNFFQACSLFSFFFCYLFSSDSIPIKRRSLIKYLFPFLGGTGSAKKHAPPVSSPQIKTKSPVIGPQLPNKSSVIGPKLPSMSPVIGPQAKSSSSSLNSSRDQVSFQTANPADLPAVFKLLALAFEIRFDCPSHIPNIL